MKHKSLIILAPILISIVSVASAATVLVSNYAAGDTSVVLTNSGSNVLGADQIGGGFAAVGYFNISDVAIVTSTASALNSAFQMLGSSGNTHYDVGGSGYFMDGGFDFSASATIDGSTNTAFAGQNIYLVVGNGASLSASTQAFIYKTNSLFALDPTSPTTLNFTAGPPAGSVILGTTGVSTTPYYSGAGTVAGNPVTTAYRAGLIAVPEPSTAVLAALGSLAFLRRRRNG